MVPAVGSPGALRVHPLGRLQLALVRERLRGPRLHLGRRLRDPICSFLGAHHLRALCGLVNRTRIVVTSGILTIRHGPLPGLGSRTIPTAELHQLYCEEIEYTDSDGHTSRTYRLNAVLKSGSKVDLLDLPEADQAHYLEQLIEGRLGIVDAAVDGEYI
jgi:hypothetical protein